MTTTLEISVRCLSTRRSLGVQYTRLLVGLPELFAQLAFQHFAGARQRERCVAELDRAWALVSGDLCATVRDHRIGGEVCSLQWHHDCVHGFAPLGVGDADYGHL